MALELFAKVETTDLNNYDSVFCITVLGAGDMYQWLLKTDVQPSDETLSYLGIDRPMFAQIMDDADERHVAMIKMAETIGRLGLSSGEKPILYVWNKFTANRILKLFKKYNFNFYSYFKTLPICINEVHKFFQRNSEGPIKMRFRDARELYGVNTGYYLKDLREVTHKLKNYEAV